MTTSVPVQINENGLRPEQKLTTRLRVARAIKNLTFEQMALELNTSTSTVHYWESNGSIPSAMLGQWAEITGQSMDLFKV